MQKLTPADLDAIEAAHKAATEGDWAECLSSLVVQDGVHIIEELAQFSGDNKRKNVRLAWMAHNALPALIAAARATVPEPIGEKHRDGGPWQVWEPFYSRWVYAKWREQSEMWRRLDGGDVIGTPTHALPLPPAPEGTNA
jgi:hypothetical protein